MFEIRTDRRKYTIKDEYGEVYFNACMQALFQAEMNVEVYEIDRKAPEPVEIPTTRGGIAWLRKCRKKKRKKSLSLRLWEN